MDKDRSKIEKSVISRAEAQEEAGVPGVPSTKEDILTPGNPARGEEASFSVLDPQYWREYRYTVKDMTGALRISRTTLLWYEAIGLVTPARDASSGWRKYNLADMFQIMGAMTMKNIGTKLSDLNGAPSEESFDSEKIDEYIATSKQQEEYFHAQTECLESMKRTVLNRGRVYEEFVEAFYFYPEPLGGKKDGYNDELDDALVRGMPISALGVMLDSKCGEETGETKWGRTIPVCYEYLFKLPKAEREVIGGCSCLCYSYTSSSFPTNTNERQQAFAAMDAYLAENGLEPSGMTFAPRIIALDQGICFALCQPIKNAQND